ncbi:MAG: hypothetical protein JW800_04145 [Candidatus Omnitrophica bacterium]|nr:hypothetical protein [Candidatus Omnitrophota bacterium]
MKIIISVFVGGIFGFLIGYVVKCNGGGCPITSDQLVTTLIGAVTGLIIALTGNRG